MMALPMTKYSTIRPIPISAFADVSPTFCQMFGSGTQIRTISAKMPNRIQRVALADHRSNSSSLSLGSLFLWPGPLAYPIRRRKKRTIAFLAFAAIALTLAIPGSYQPLQSSPRRLRSYLATASALISTRQCAAAMSASVSPAQMHDHDPERGYAARLAQALLTPAFVFTQALP